MRYIISLTICIMLSFVIGFNIGSASEKANTNSRMIELVSENANLQETSTHQKRILEVLLNFKDCKWHVTKITGEGQELYIFGALIEDDANFKDVDEVVIATKKRNRGFINLK